MPKCCKCHNRKDTPYSYGGDEPLCADCARNYPSCVVCGSHFEPEVLIAGKCPKCEAESED